MAGRAKRNRTRGGNARPRVSRVAERLRDNERAFEVDLNHHLLSLWTIVTLLPTMLVVSLSQYEPPDTINSPTRTLFREEKATLSM